MPLRKCCTCIILIMKNLNLLITTFFTLRLCIGPPTENYCVKYKVRMIFNPVGKPKLTPAACDLLCPAGRSGCSCHVMAVIWRLDEMSRNNEMKNQCENDVPCSSSPRKWGIPGALSTFYDPRPLKLRKLDP